MLMDWLTEQVVLDIDAISPGRTASEKFPQNFRHPMPS